MCDSATCPLPAPPPLVTCDMEPHAFPQQRLLQNAPREMTRPVLTELFRQALRYW